ncbi:MAG: hypothetical protein AB1515_07490 [Nitrospirota bacterium]
MRGGAVRISRRPAGRADHGWRRRSMWIGAGLAAAMLAAVWERSEVVSLGYEVGELRKLRDLELQRHRALILESASLSSLERVDRLAADTLGMGAAKPGQIQLVPERPGVEPASMLAALTGGAQVAEASFKERP